MSKGVKGKDGRRRERKKERVGEFVGMLRSWRGMRNGESERKRGRSEMRKVKRGKEFSVVRGRCGRGGVKVRWVWGEVIIVDRGNGRG